MTNDTNYVEESMAVRAADTSTSGKASDPWVGGLVPLNLSKAALVSSGFERSI